MKKLLVFFALLAFAVAAVPNTAGAKPAQPKVKVKVLTKNQAALLKAKKLSVQVRSTAKAKIKLTAVKGRSSGLFKVKTIKFKRKGKRTVGLGLTAKGRKTLAACGTKTVKAVAKFKRGKRKATAKGSKTLSRDNTRCLPPNPPPPAPKPNPQTIPGCDPIDPANCMAPFPNDYFTKPDSSTDTDLRVDFKPEQMPTNATGVSTFNESYNRNDGFSPNSVIVTRIPGLDTPEIFRENNLVSQLNIGSYADADQRVVLIDTVTNQRVPIWAELDMVPGTPNPHADDLLQGTPQDRVLMIHPAATLEYGRRYVVAVRNMTAGGMPLPVNDVFKYIRDGVETDNQQVEARRAQMAKVFETTGAAGLTRSSLNVAWDFTVSSERSLTERVLKMRDDAFEQLGDDDLADGDIDGAPPEITITEPDLLYGTCADANTACVGNQSRYAFKRIRGTIEVPCYMNAPTMPYNTVDPDTPCASGSRLNYAPGTDLPTQKMDGNTPVTWDAPFTCIIPRTGENENAMQTSGLGAVIFGHGLMGDDGGTVDLGNYPAALEGVACGTTWLGLSSQDLPQHLLRMINILNGSSNLSLFPALPDRTQQGYINTLYLARALAHEDGFASLPAFQDGGEPVFEIDQEDPGQDLGYFGVSLGGINGGATTAIAPDWERATLAVPGIGFSTLLTRSTQFNRFLPTVYNSYTDPIARSIGMSMLQMLWDRGEPSAYAKSMLNGGLGTPEHEVLIQESFGDHQVANVQTQTLARSLGATIKAPILAPGRITDLGTLANGGNYLFTDMADVDPYWGIPTGQSSAFNVPGGLPSENAVMMTTDTGPVTHGVGGNPVLGTKANPDWNIAPVTGTASVDNEGYDPHQPGATSPATQQMAMPFLLDQGFHDPCGNGIPDIYGQPPYVPPTSSPNPIPCPAPPIDYIRNGR